MMNIPQLNENKALNKLLKASYTDDKFCSHTSMIKPRGKFLISRSSIEKFYEIYNPNIPNGVTEKPGHYSMLRFDFDIKKSIEDYEFSYKETGRFYEPSDVEFVIQKINDRLKQVVICSNDDLVCCLLEKDIYQKNETTMSGGFHLQYPKLFLETDVVINGIIDAISKEVLNETALEFDIGVYKNPWLMYGASKSVELKPYTLSKIYNVDIEQMTLFDAFKNYELFNTDEIKIEITPENVEKLLPRILSINPFNRQTQETKPHSFVKPQVVEKKKKENKKNDDRDVETKLAECRQLLPLLNSHRVEDYHDWMTLGWCLYSIGDGCSEAFDLWDEVSQNCEKYDPCACENAWEKMTVGNYTIATLHKFARDDNLELYNTIFKKNDCWVRDLLFDFSDLTCAEKFKEHCDGEIFFTDSHKWVIFDTKTKFWSFNNNDKSLVYPVSKFFSNWVKKYQLEFTENYDCNKKEDEEHLQFIMKCVKKVGMTKFANGVISQLQSLMTENSIIMEKFDTNPALIAFKNGKVIDLANGGNSRDILKEDFIITHTGYDLPERNNNDIETMRQIVRGMVETDDDLKSLLSALSCFIYGQNINEKFFVFTGSGGNGKGVLDKSLMTVLGNYYKTINVNQLTTYEKDGNRANSELTSCQYARCVMTSEPDVGRRNKLITPIIKKWTGGDKLSTRDLNSKKFEFFVKFVLALQCNDIPELSALDGGTERRMRIIELYYEFVDNNGQALSERQKYKDVTLKETVGKPELRNAMLFILVDTWLENKGIFYESAKIKEFTNEYFETQNPVKLWFQSNYEIDGTARLPSSIIFNDYKEMTMDNDITLTQFGRYLKELCKSNKSDGKQKYHCSKKIIERNEMTLERLLG